MDQIRSLSQMIEEARKLCASKGKKRVSVAMAEDAGLISAIEEARRTGYNTIREPATKPKIVP